MVKTNNIVCAYCEQKFPDRQKLKNHTKAKHKSMEPLEAEADDELPKPGPSASKAELRAFR